MKATTGEKTYWTVLVAWLFVVLAGGVGWVMNIVKLVNSLDGELTAMVVARAVGVIAVPLGAVLGYL